MRIEAPKPDMGMSPWLVTILIMFTVFFNALLYAVACVIICVVGIWGWCFWKAWNEMREERRALEPRR